MDTEYEWEPGEARDEYVEQARPALIRFFAEHSRKVFYLMQLEVLFEKDFFHWVTRRALYSLAEESVVSTEVVETKGRRVRLFFDRGHRYRRRQVKSLVELIEEMSDLAVAAACGEHADVLFFNALMARQCVAYAQDAREYRGRLWVKTVHDLDFIIERDGTGYGCEVKNAWGYIEREELEIKVEMCKFLGLRPLFIMRAAPKSYVYEINRARGFGLIFKWHLYPFGMQPLTARIKEVLGLPADCPRAIESGTIDRFVNWHEKQV